MRELLLIFQEVEDPRRGNAKRHDLHEMLVIALLSTLTGGRTCVEMEDYGCAAERWLREFLALKNGIPSHDTFSRLFGLLDPASLQKALLRLAQDWADRLGGVVAVDGKVLRRSFEDASERSPTHLLQAFAAESKLTLAQLEVDGKSNEIPALPKLLELVDVKGRTVTADALHAQRGTAAAIVAKGGDYALALKGNQETLRADVSEYLDNPPESAKLLSHQQVDKGQPTKVGARREAHGDGLPRRRLAAGAPRLARSFRLRQGGRRAASRRRLGEHRHPLLLAQRQALGRAFRAHRPFPLGDREQPALGARRVDGRRPGAQPQGQLRRLSGGCPPAGSEHRADASRQAIHPPQVHPRPARRRLPCST